VGADRRPEGSPPQKVFKQNARVPAVNVISTSPDDDVGLHGIVCGEYAEAGTFQGRRCFQKIGDADTSVYLYYHVRESEGMQGWWFGDQVGGQSVWLHNAERGFQPPRSGWIFRGKEVRTELQVVTPAEKREMDNSADGSERVNGLDLSVWEDRVQQATQRMATLELDVSEAVEMSRSAAVPDVDSQTLVRAQQQLTKLAQPLLQMNQFVARQGLIGMNAPPEFRILGVQLADRARQLQADVKLAEQRLLEARREHTRQEDLKRQRIREEARRKEVEAKHHNEFEVMGREAAEKVESVEIEMEKVSIAAAPFDEESGDFMESVLMQAVSDTEQKVRAATGILNEAKRVVAGKVAQVRRIAPGLNTLTILEELNGLQNKLNEFQSKLTFYGASRQRYQQRVAAKKAFAQLAEQVALAEVEVEKAMMATQPLFGTSKEAAQSAEGPLNTAQAAVSKVTRLLEARLKQPKAGSIASNDEVESLRVQVGELTEKLKQAQEAVKEMQERATADDLLGEISTRSDKIETELQRMSDASSLFMDDASKEQDADALIAEVSKITPSVQSALSESKSFCSRTLAKIKGNKSGPIEEVEEAMRQLQQQLEDGQSQLQEFIAKGQDLRRSQLLEVAEQAVQGAEDKVQKLADLTDALGAPDSSSIDDTVTDDVKEGLQQVGAAEREAQESIAAARKRVLETSAEMRKLLGAGSPAPTEVSQLQDRVNSMQQEAARLRSAAKEAKERQQERVRASELIQQATQQVDQVETQVLKAREAEPSLDETDGLQVSGVMRIVSEADAEVAATDAQKSIVEARALLARITAEVRRLSRKVSEGCLGSIANLQSQLDASGAKLVEVQADIAKRQRAVRQQQAAEKVSQVEAAVQKLGTAFESLSGHAQSEGGSNENACTELDGAEQEAIAQMSNTQEFFAAQLRELRNQSGQGVEMATEISKWQAKLRHHQVELTRLTRECSERKQRLLAHQLLQEIPLTVDKLEADVQAAHEAAAPLLASNKSQMLDDLRLQLVTGALRAYMKDEGVSGRALFAKIATGTHATLGELAAFLDDLPPAEPSGSFLITMTSEQAASALCGVPASAAESNESNSLSLENFESLLRDRYICVAATPIVDAPVNGNRKCMLEVGELVDIMEEQVDLSGAAAVQCALTRDGATGWVLTQSSEGKQTLAPSSSSSGHLESIAAYVEGLCTRCTEVAAQADQKVSNCPQQGSLADIRAKLLQLKTKVNVHQMKLDQLKKRVSSARALLIQQWELMQEKNQEARCTGLVEGLVKKVTTAVSAAEERVNKVLEGIRDRSVLKSSFEEGSSQAESLKKMVSDTNRAVSGAKTIIAQFTEKDDAAKSPNRNTILEARVELVKLASRVKSLERRSSMVVGSK